MTRQLYLKNISKGSALYRAYLFLIPLKEIYLMLIVTFPSRISGTSFDSLLRHKKLATRDS